MVQQLSVNAKKVWRLRATIIFLVASLLLGGVYVFSRIIALGIMVLNIIIYLFTVLIAVPYVYKITILEVRPDGIAITKGVLMKKRMNILAKKIQYVELLQSPLQRVYNVYTVAFHTAGATVFVSQVDQDLGNQFREYKKSS
ncbi:MAG: PH domain-containing protein [Ruminococcus sp.]|nr:PH domain-containing protein [Ruminococcus sp.]